MGDWNMALRGVAKDISYLFGSPLGGDYDYKLYPGMLQNQVGYDKLSGTSSIQGGIGAYYEGLRQDARRRLSYSERFREAVGKAKERFEGIKLTDITLP